LHIEFYQILDDRIPVDEQPHALILPILLAETIGGYKPIDKWIIYTGSQRQLLENGVHVLPYVEAL
jgi:hypothetical protein